jgi:hypothetical protein
MRTKISRRAQLIGLAGLVWVICFTAFIVIQWKLSLDGRTYFEGSQYRRVTDLAAARYDVWLATFRFLGASLAMTALIFGGRRRFAFALPIVMALALPAIFGGVPDCTSFDQSAVPHGVGPGWSFTTYVEGCGYPLFASWMGTAIDFALVMVPAVVVAAVATHRGRLAAAAVRTRPGGGSIVIAAMLCLIGFGLLLSAREMGMLGYPIHWRPWWPIHLSLATFGAMLGLRRSWWSLALVAVPLALYPLEAGLPYGFEFDLELAAYPVLVTVLAASWLPLAIGMEKARTLLAGMGSRHFAAPTNISG